MQMRKVESQKIRLQYVRVCILQCVKKFPIKVLRKSRTQFLINHHQLSNAIDSETCRELQLSLELERRPLERLGVRSACCSSRSSALPAADAEAGAVRDPTGKSACLRAHSRSQSGVTCATSVLPARCSSARDGRFEASLSAATT